MFGSVSFAVIHTRLGVTGSQLQQSETRLEITDNFCSLLNYQLVKHAGFVVPDPCVCCGPVG